MSLIYHEFLVPGPILLLVNAPMRDSRPTFLSFPLKACVIESHSAEVPMYIHIQWNF
jgi:hypothetical protein